MSLTSKAVRLAAVVATPPGLNPGMAASELGLLAFVQRQGLAQDLAVFQICSLEERLTGTPAETQSVLRRARLPISYRHARVDWPSLVAADVILFWGDFLHMAQYHRGLTRPLAALPDVGTVDGARLWIEKVFLLRDASDERLQHAASFGTTVLFNTISDELDSDYGPLYARFVRGIDSIWVRDVISAAAIAAIRGDYANSLWGCDCVQLFRRDDLDAFVPTRLPDTDRFQHAVSVFAGRSPSQAADLLAVAAGVADTLDTHCQWLPWGSFSAFPGLAALADQPDADEMSIFALLRSVARSAAVVTDTYHLALIAWTFGVPAVLLSAPPTATADVNSGAEPYRRDKREVLFSQYNALDFLLRSDDVADRDRREARVSRLCASLSDAVMTQAVVERFGRHARATEEACAAKLHQLLGQVAPLLSLP